MSDIKTVDRLVRYEKRIMRYGTNHYTIVSRFRSKIRHEDVPLYQSRVIWGICLESQVNKEIEEKTKAMVGIERYASDWWADFTKICDTPEILDYLSQQGKVDDYSTGLNTDYNQVKIEYIGDWCMEKILKALNAKQFQMLMHECELLNKEKGLL